MRAESGTLTRAILDSLDTRAAAIDPEGTVIAANQPWLLHAAAGDPDPARAGVGMNYLDLWDRAAASGKGEVADAPAGIREARPGRAERYQIDYRLEDGDLWQTLTALPLAGAPGAVVSHLDITERKAQELHLESVAFHSSRPDAGARDAVEERVR